MWIPKCKSEFGKQNCVNIDIMLAMELNIDKRLFRNFRFYIKKI